MAKYIGVIYSGKYKSTKETAQFIAKKCEEKGLLTSVVEAKSAGDPSEYDAVILGSALYMSAWRKDLVKWMKSHQASLKEQRIFAFVMGPTEESDATQALGGRLYPDHMKALIEALALEKLVAFGGVVEKENLGFFDRKILEKMKVPDGDYRDWAVIEAFSEAVVEALSNP